MLPLSAVWSVKPLPAAAYWTDHPARGTGTLPRLWSSMKSFLYVAPALPPPPYTWLMTTELSQRFGLVVVKPVGVVNWAPRAMPEALCAAVVTRI